MPRPWRFASCLSSDSAASSWASLISSIRDGVASPAHVPCVDVRVMLRTESERRHDPFGESDRVFGRHEDGSGVVGCRFRKSSRHW